MVTLEGKVALVTGSSRGIGRDIAVELARAGADVAVNYPFEAELENAKETAKLIGGLGKKAIIIEADVSNPQSCEEMMSKVVSELGKLDILVNNAGVTADTLIAANERV